MKRYKIFLEFYKSTLPLSGGSAVLSLLFNFKMATFCFIFCTIGFLAALMYKEYYRKNDFFFYYNSRMAKRHLYSATFALNAIISIIILILFNA